MERNTGIRLSNIRLRLCAETISDCCQFSLSERKELKTMSTTVHFFPFILPSSSFSELLPTIARENQVNLYQVERKSVRDSGAFEITDLEIHNSKTLPNIDQN